MNMQILHHPQFSKQKMNYNCYRVNYKMIIGISGKMGCGKDYVCNNLIIPLILNLVFLNLSWIIGTKLLNPFCFLRLKLRKAQFAFLLI